MRIGATPPAWDDSFLDGGSGGVQRIVDAVLLLFDFDFGGAADLDHGDATCGLCQPLLAAGDPTLISVQACFSCHLGPGPRM